MVTTSFRDQKGVMTTIPFNFYRCPVCGAVVDLWAGLWEAGDE